MNAPVTELSDLPDVKLAEQLPETHVAALVIQAARDLNRDGSEREVRVGIPRHVTSEFVSCLQLLTGNQLTQQQFEELLEQAKQDHCRDEELHPGKKKDRLSRLAKGRNARRYRNGEASLKFVDAYRLLLLFDDVANLPEVREDVAIEIHRNTDFWYLRLIALETVKDWERDAKRRQRDAEGSIEAGQRQHSFDEVADCCSRFRNLLRHRATLGYAILKNANQLMPFG